MSPLSDAYGGYVTPVPVELDDGTTFTLLLERAHGQALCERCGDPCLPERFAAVGQCDCCGRPTHVAVVCDSCGDVLDWKREREAEGG